MGRGSLSGWNGLYVVRGRDGDSYEERVNLDRPGLWRLDTSSAPQYVPVLGIHENALLRTNGLRLHRGYAGTEAKQGRHL